MTYFNKKTRATEIISIAATKEEKKEIQKFAKKENCNVSQFLKGLVKMYKDKQGSNVVIEEELEGK